MAERSRRRTFGPVVLLGLASGALTAVAAAKPAVDGGGSSGGGSDAFSSTLTLTFDGHMPAVTSLALVVLACWGVLLVTRGRVRRGVAVLGVLAALGALAAAVVAYGQLASDLDEQLAQLGIADADVHHTTWYWVALGAALVATACSVLAVAWCPAWPEMGGRYDAPVGSSPDQPPLPAAAPEDQSSLDLWKAIDEGRDPTEADPE